MLTLSSWRFAPDTDEEPLKSFKQGRGKGWADVLQANKNEESNHKEKQNYLRGSGSGKYMRIL